MVLPAATYREPLKKKTEKEKPAMTILDFPRNMRISSEFVTVGEMQDFMRKQKYWHKDYVALDPEDE